MSTQTEMPIGFVRDVSLSPDGKSLTATVQIADFVRLVPVARRIAGEAPITVSIPHPGIWWVRFQRPLKVMTAAGDTWEGSRPDDWELIAVDRVDGTMWAGEWFGSDERASSDAADVLLVEVGPEVHPPEVKR